MRVHVYEAGEARTHGPTTFVGCVPLATSSQSDIQIVLLASESTGGPCFYSFLLNTGLVSPAEQSGRSPRLA